MDPNYSLMAGKKIEKMNGLGNSCKNKPDFQMENKFYINN